MSILFYYIDTRAKYLRGKFLFAPLTFLRKYAKLYSSRNLICFMQGVQLCDFVLPLFPCVKDCVTTSEVHVGVRFACKAHFFYFQFLGGLLMFNFISEKIKTLAKALTIIGCIISILYGILSIPSNLIAAVLIAGLGCLLSWASSFALYGLGELIETTQSMKQEQSDTFRLLQKINANLTEINKKLSTFEDNEKKNTNE